MKNGISRKTHKRESIGARVVFGLAMLGALVVIVRSVPDLIRYLRVRRM
jgi:hypothetical protein